MDNTFFTPDQPNKDKGFQSQKQIVFEALYGQPKTMLMAALETGILRANICRYVAEFRKDGKIRLTHYGLCKVTKHRAGYYTTHPELIKAIVEPTKPQVI